MQPQNQSPSQSLQDRRKQHPSLTPLDRSKGYVYHSTWTPDCNKELNAVPANVRQQAIDTHEAWRKGDPTAEVKPIKEWKGRDVYEMVIGNWRAFATRRDPVSFEWYWFGSAQNAKKKLTSSFVNWYTKSALDNR